MSSVSANEVFFFNYDAVDVDATIVNDVTDETVHVEVCVEHRQSVDVPILLSNK